MNQDPYEFDAKARNDQTSRDRTAKNKQVLKNHRSPSLAKLNFSQYRRVTPSRIDCLTKGQYAHPVVSLYLNISSDRTLQQKDIYQTLFNSLKHTALQERKTYLDSLDHEQHQQLLRPNASEPEHPRPQVVTTYPICSTQCAPKRPRDSHHRYTYDV